MSKKMNISFDTKSFPEWYGGAYISEDNRLVPVYRVLANGSRQAMGTVCAKTK